MRTLARAIVEAEAEAKADKPRPPLTYEQKLAKDQQAEREGLCNAESLDIFQTWFLFGGMQRGLSIEEVLCMPAWLRQDFVFMTTTIADERERLEREQRFHQTRQERRRL